MSPRLSTRCALALLGAMVVASGVGLLALGPLDVAVAPHRLTDTGPPFGLSNGGGVLLQAPLLLAALVATWSACRSALHPELRRAWAVFFAFAALAALASAVDHARPSVAGHVLAKMPEASACALLASLFLAERAGLGWVGPVALRCAIAAGPLGALLWFASDLLLGQPDYRLLLWLEHLPILLVPLGVWGLRSRGLRSADWIVALLWFGFAELVEWADLLIWQATGSLVSGHALHHLPMAACIGSLAWSVARQSGARGVSSARSRQFHTSCITSG